MPKISRVEVFQVDLAPKVLRSDAIQAFSKQETPMVRVWTDDGVDGTGYSYTIGTGGSAVVALLRDYMAPWLLGRDAEMVEEIWKGLFFYTHANSVGATVSLALAAVDVALWDLRCKRACAPLHLVAGGAQRRIPIYNTEGGWLNFTTEELVAHRGAGSGFSRLQGQGRAAARRRGCSAPSHRSPQARTRLRDHGRRESMLHRLRGDPTG